MTAVDVRTPLFRTAGGARLHIPGCYHVHGVEVVAATDQDRAAMEVCSVCQDELDGYGRKYHADLDAALRHFGAHAGTWAEIKRRLAPVAWDTVWTPYSLSYIAVGLDGRGVAWVGKTYVYAEDRFVELPGYRPGGGGGVPVEQWVGDVCPTCRIALPLSGTCDEC